MKIPRDVSGDRLIRVLQKIRYSVVRQKGSHVRLEYPHPPIHGITVPLHSPLKVGTLQAILAEVAEKRATTIEVLLNLL